MALWTVHRESSGFCGVVLFCFVFDLRVVRCHRYSTFEEFVGSWFLVHSDDLRLLTGTFRPLTFKVVIDLVGLMSTIFVTFFFIARVLDLPFFFFFLSSTLFLPFMVFVECFIWVHFPSILQLYFSFYPLLMVTPSLQYTVTTTPKSTSITP